MKASPLQREKVRGQRCANCLRPGCDPAHIASRAQGGCNHTDCVVPLCRACHDAFDQRRLDLLPALEPHYRRELAHALMHLGLEGLRRRLTP